MTPEATPEASSPSPVPSSAPLPSPALPPSAPSPPAATYRLQLGPDLTLAQVEALVDYLDALGVSHLYLSPVLQAAPGSTHGYDVVDHARVSEDLGGRAGLERLARRLHGRGLGVVADVVPNHMAVPTPLWRNRVMWSVLRDGPSSPYARWLDVDWTVPARAVLVPVLGQRIGDVLAAGELRVDEAEVPVGARGEPVRERVLRYYDHVLPLRAGTADLPVPELVDRQWYRLAYWRVADEEVNYRRFFDIDTLAAVRVEEPEVFDATHDVLVDLFAAGVLDGFRIDHPDGLADPAGYLARLRARGEAEAGRRPWVVVEKIVEGDEELPADWCADGTTGYDTLLRVGGLFVDPAAAGPLLALYGELAGAEEARPFADVVDEAKREVVEGVQYAEVHRLVDLLVDICQDDVHLRDHTRRALHDAVVELLVAMDRYRAYVVPGETLTAEAEAVLGEAAERARAQLPPERHATLELVAGLVLGRGPRSEAPAGGAPADARRRAELVVRFQQTCGPVMAKGVEDTAFYRWHRLVALNEVGGDPDRFGVSPDELHAYAGRLSRTWPATMTTLSTHDTKRSEDARARLVAAVEDPARWVEAVRGWHEAAAPHRTGEGLPDGGTEYLLWQTLVATWPVGIDRLGPYLQKAAREAKRHTTWTEPDERYERALLDLAEGVLGDAGLAGAVSAFVEEIEPWYRVVVLGQKLVQLCLPGVPDVYQGTELVDRSLVDPDNRRPVDYAERRRRLARLDAGEAPADLHDEKLLVTSRALRLRRELADHLRGPGAGHWPLAATTGSALAFGRGRDDEPSVLAVVTRRPSELERHGGWDRHTVHVPEGRWLDVLTGREHDGGALELAGLLDQLPVALLRHPPPTPRA